MSARALSRQVVGIIRVIPLAVAVAATRLAANAQVPKQPSNDTVTHVHRSAGDWVDGMVDVGHDNRGVPHYARRSFTSEERELLRRIYGIEDPTLLYVSDSTDEALVKYDTRRKTCATCYVNSYRVGFVSVRRPGESWEEVERRIRATPLSAFPASARVEDRSTSELDPSIREDVNRMLVDAEHAGFVVRVAATYRSPMREAFLMRRGGRTHTLTSMHSYGRAIDVTIGDGVLAHRATRERWIAFRRWVTEYEGGKFRILGAPDRTWDWRHVEVPSADIGVRDIEEAIDRARACTEPASTTPCDFGPHRVP
jgi:hypothetical protein